MAKNILLGLIGATTALFVMMFIGAAEYSNALFSLAAGLIWLFVEIRSQRSLSTIFFVVFFVLGILGGLNHLPTPLILIGISMNLAAWDVSRLRARIADKAEADVIARLETRHLQKLAVVTGIGLILALLSTTIQISLSFVALAVIALAVMIVLRASMRYLRSDEQPNA